MIYLQISVVEGLKQLFETLSSAPLKTIVLGLLLFGMSAQTEAGFFNPSLEEYGECVARETVKGVKLKQASQGSWLSAGVLCLF